MRKVDPVKHDKKRREILEAAGRCFARDGFARATIAQICAEAKISPGHLYHYFASKEAIVGAMAEAGLEHAAARFSHMLESSNALDALIAEIEHIKASSDRARKLLVLDMLAEAGRNPVMGDVLRRHSQIVRQQLTAFLSEAQTRGQVDRSLDPNLAAALLMAVIDGSITLTIRDPELDSGKSVKLLKILISRFLMPQATA